jgi:DNA-binding winged helix-turn-helix (wHTH) protein
LAGRPESADFRSEQKHEYNRLVRVLILGEVSCAEHWASTLRQAGFAVLRGETGQDASGVPAGLLIVGAMREPDPASFRAWWRNAGRTEPVLLVGRDLPEHAPDEEVLARARAADTRLAGRLHLGEEVVVDLERQQVQRRGEAQPLTAQEVRLLAALAHTGSTWSREELLTEVWGHTASVVTRAVDNAVMRLRDKIEPDPEAPRFLLTERGAGYRLAGAHSEPAEEILPVPVRTDVIGRAPEIASVSSAFARGTRLVTLTGPPGIGKSAIASSLPASWSATPAELDWDPPRAIATLRRRGTTPGRISTEEPEPVLRWLALVWDGAPQARFLVSCPLPLGHPHEQQIRVEALALQPATQLFLARAAALGEPVSEDLARQIATRLAGHPHALETAATRLRLMSPEELLARLPDEMSPRTGGSSEECGRRRGT